MNSISRFHLRPAHNPAVQQYCSWLLRNLHAYHYHSYIHLRFPYILWRLSTRHTYKVCTCTRLYSPVLAALSSMLNYCVMSWSKSFHPTRSPCNMIVQQAHFTRYILSNSIISLYFIPTLDHFLPVPKKMPT